MSGSQKLYKFERSGRDIKDLVNLNNATGIKEPGVLL